MQISSPAKNSTPEDWVAVLGMAALCVITMANVMVRYLSDQSIAWTEEFSVFLLVLTTMAGTAAAALRDTHIRIEFFLDSGDLARRRGLAIVGAGLTVLFFLALAFLTGRMSWDEFHYGEISMGLGVPRWWYTAWVPALSIVIAFRAFQVLGKKLREKA